MSKKKREIVFNKTGGKCSYCGCSLNKGWHIDHVNPVDRKFERTKEFYRHNITGEKISEEKYWSIEDRINYTSVKSKLIVVGFNKPENDTIENKMPACPSCNINKHGMDLEQFRSFIERFITSLNRDNVNYKVAKRYGLIQETGKKVIFYFETL